MANKFGRDILIQAEDPQAAASWYVENLGFEITGNEPNMVTAVSSAESCRSVLKILNSESSAEKAAPVSVAESPVAVALNP